MLEAEILMKAKVPMRRDRDSDRGNDGGAPVLQEEEDDEDDDDDCFADGSNDFIDRFADDQGGVDRDDALKAGGIRFSSSARTARQRLSTSRALALESCRIPTPNGIAALVPAARKTSGSYCSFQRQSLSGPHL